MMGHIKEPVRRDKQHKIIELVTFNKMMMIQEGLRKL
jgi:hypothetical protein